MRTANAVSNPVRFELHGYLVGPIWWPNGAECFKPLAYDISREGARFSEPLTLREHVLRATNDGDFQHCEVADGFVLATVERRQGSTTIKRTRAFPLERFPSVADMVRADWEGPALQDWED